MGNNLDFKRFMGLHVTGALVHAHAQEYQVAFELYCINKLILYH